MSHFLGAESLIVERLQQTVPTALIATRNIRAAISDKWVVKNALGDSISVCFHNAQPLKSGGIRQRGQYQIYSQLWIVVLTVRDVTNSAASQQRGEIITAILESLLGWKPAPEYTELHSEASPFFVVDDNNGFVHSPFVFSTEFIMKGEIGGKK